MQPTDEKPKNEAGSSNIDVEKLIYEKRERLKELTAINETTSIIKQNKPVPETLAQICAILPDAWQYPEHTSARIRYDESEFTTVEFRETEWKQEQVFETIDNQRGTIEIFYSREFPVLDEGPFMKEERDLLISSQELFLSPSPVPSPPGEGRRGEVMAFTSA